MSKQCNTIYKKFLPFTYVSSQVKCFFQHLFMKWKKKMELEMPDLLLESLSQSLFSFCIKNNEITLYPFSHYIIKE